MFPAAFPRLRGLHCRSDLTEEGFMLYRAKGKIWGYEVRSEDMKRDFPRGQMASAQSGRAAVTLAGSL